MSRREAMIDGPEACHDVRQYERKGRHYPMKLLPESSIKKTKRTESVWEAEHTPALAHLRAREVQTLPLGSFLSLSIIPQFPDITYACPI